MSEAVNPNENVKMVWFRLMKSKPDVQTKSHLNQSSNLPSKNAVEPTHLSKVFLVSIVVFHVHKLDEFQCWDDTRFSE